MEMSKLEKVIKGLHDARRYLEDKEWSDRCASPHIDAINDALALLKEQEPVEPVLDKQNGRIWLCGNCGCFVGLTNYSEFDKFCRECGHPVKWEEAFNNIRKEN